MTMALAAEIVFQTAVSAAESTRQASRASAFTTYGFVAANLAAYKTALAAADVAYITAVNAAANTSGLLMGNIGQTGPIPTVAASLVA
jgi:hypothetical protein